MSEMIRIENIKLTLSQSEDELPRLAAECLGVNPNEIREWRIAKKSVDARRKKGAGTPARSTETSQQPMAAHHKKGAGELTSSVETPHQSMNAHHEKGFDAPRCSTETSQQPMAAHHKKGAGELTSSVETPHQSMNAHHEKGFDVPKCSTETSQQQVSTLHQIRLVYAVDIMVNNPSRFLSLPSVKRVTQGSWSPPRAFSMPCRPVVVGMGPAGLFAALTLAEAGAEPVLLERGRPVEKRQQDVEAFWKTGRLQPASNVQFGEGGAGAFSDGKLTTGTKSPYRDYILQTLVKYGAPEEILYLNKPHIGTDLLLGVVKGIRERIIFLGGTVCFETRMDSLLSENGRLVGVRAMTPDGAREWETRAVILAVGHSARDTFQSLVDQNIALSSKPFAVGVRIEHLQSEIDRVQYGGTIPRLGAADYKLAVHLPYLHSSLSCGGSSLGGLTSQGKQGSGVYTFCMCPGGQVVAAASEEGGVVTNGMSHHARDGRNANSAVLVGVPSFANALDGVAFQRRLECAAFTLGGGDYRAPAQLVGDFMKGIPSRQLGEVEPTYQPGVTLCDLRECLPDTVYQPLSIGLSELGRRLQGFDRYDAVLTGVESRSSSPVRIERGESLQSISLSGLYPCGEGAGYAGGILSAAADGVRCAEAVLKPCQREDD